MINRLRRKTYQAIISDGKKRRAISFAIFMKNAKPASVIKDWSNNGLARISHLAEGTCRSYIKILRDLNLVQTYSKKGHNYLVFMPLKEPKRMNKRGTGYYTPKHMDVMLGKYDPTSIKTIETHLRALLICEIQRQKDYIQQSISAKQHPKSKREYKKARKVCSARGWYSFVDNGISNRTICKKLHCAPNSAIDTIKYGEKARLFIVTRSIPTVIVLCPGEARDAIKYMNGDKLWCTDNAVYYQPANKFSLPVKRKSKHP